MKNKQIKMFGTVLLSLVLAAVAAPNASSAPTLTASVADQQCRGGDGVNVTLTATLSPSRSGVTYAWDLNNDGVLDTAASADPTVVTSYPDEVSVTATVFVMKNGRTKGSDSVTFRTLRCP